MDFIGLVTDPKRVLISFFDKLPSIREIRMYGTRCIGYYAEGSPVMLDITMVAPQHWEVNTMVKKENIEQAPDFVLVPPFTTGSIARALNKLGLHEELKRRRAELREKLLAAADEEGGLERFLLKQLLNDMG